MMTDIEIIDSAINVIKTKGWTTLHCKHPLNESACIVGSLGRSTGVEAPTDDLYAEIARNLLRQRPKLLQKFVEVLEVDEAAILGNEEDQDLKSPQDCIVSYVIELLMELNDGTFHNQEDAINLMEKVKSKL